VNPGSFDGRWIAPARTALVLIDMQVDFASPDGALGRQGFDMTAPQAAVAQAERLAAAARSAGVPCVFVRLITRAEDDTAFTRDYRLRRGDDTPPLCREGSRGADFVGPKPQGGDYVVSKSRYSGFTGTRLEESLRVMGRDTLVLAGLTTECCIDATARDAFERDFHVVIVADAVAAYTPELHNSALKALELNCGFVVSAGGVTAAWDKSM
jgi:nicotinamidase-related amidase